MAAGQEIAKLFGTLGFNVDETGVKKFERHLRNVEARMKKLGQAQAKNSQLSRSSNQAAKGVKRHGQALAGVISRYDRYDGALRKVREDYRKINSLYHTNNISSERRNQLLQKTIERYRQIQREGVKAGRAMESSGRGRGRPARLGPQFRSGMTQFIPGFGAGFAAMQSVQSYQQAIGMEQGLTSATGSREQAIKDMEYLQQVTQKLGMYIGDVGKNFTGMAAAARGSSMEGQGVRDIFEGISAQARVLNLTAADTEGVFRAVTQIMNKNQVMAEELKNQLGERMPGAIQATARALGMFTEEGTADTQALFKAMENGELVADEVLPLLAEEMRRTAETGGALDNAMNNTSASINRFRNTLWNANRTFNEAGFDEAVGNLFGTMSRAIAEAEPLWILLGRATQFVGSALEAPIELFGILASKLGFATEEGYKMNDFLKSLLFWSVVLLKPLRKIATWLWLIPEAASAARDLLENGFEGKGWKEIALQIGLVLAGLVALVAPLMKIAKMIKGVGKDAKSTFDAAKRFGRGGKSTGTTSGSRTSTSSGGSSYQDRLRRQGNTARRAGQMRKARNFLKMSAIRANPLIAGAMALGHSEKLGGGMDYIENSAGRPSFTDKLDSQRNMFNMVNPSNPLYMRPEGNSTQLNGDVIFNIESNDPEEVGRIVEDRFSGLLRLESDKNPTTEQ